MATRSEYAQSTIRVLLYTYAYVFLEWLFFVTKPSFLAIRPWSERILALFAGVWPFLLLTLGMHFCLCVVAWTVDRIGKRSNFVRKVLKFMPALIVAAIILILVDNFTYTMFKWGIVKTGAYTVPLYWVLFAGGFIWALRSKFIQVRLKPLAVGGLLLLLIVPLAWSYTGIRAVHENSVGAIGGVTKPNIIMFASDGVNADHMSAYGYRRETTPNLDVRLGSALVAENAFTNSGMTTGSLTSMMTGKYPGTTKVIYRPQTLQGEDAYEHLPRILRKLGYKSLQETVGYFADAKDLNWLDSFNYANGRELHWSRIDRLPIKLQAAGQLVDRVRGRAQERVEQLLFMKRMTDHYAAVAPEETAAGWVITDDQRMAHVFDFIEHTHQPFFIHVHLLGTHCCTWKSEKKYFPINVNASAAEQADVSFDNAIRQSDEYFGRMMDLLERKGLLGNTLIVYSSDHVKGWDFRSQIPLILFFPNGQYSGKMTKDTQIIDVAPTILDYMNVEIPGWMEGRSIIEGELPEHRPIFSAFTARYVDAAAHHAEIGPPYYDLAKAGLVECNRWYIFSLNDKSIESGVNPNYHGGCDSYEVPDNEAAKLIISKHLHERGFIF